MSALPTTWKKTTLIALGILLLLFVACAVAAGAGLATFDQAAELAKWAVMIVGVPLLGKLGLDRKRERDHPRPD